MANFSRNTFDKLKHYVGVRLQQGVPLIDADWNEQEDIRKYELQAFLKWFVGDGVPEGNDGFLIHAFAGGGVNTMVLTANTVGGGLSSITINQAASTAAQALGFGLITNSIAQNGAPARLTGNMAEPFALAAGMTLIISADNLPEETVVFQAGDFANIGAATAVEVATAINNAVANLTATPGTGNDFIISGGDGTPENAGRCLVEGMDTINEHYLGYTSQPLYNNNDLALMWNVPILPPLAPPLLPLTERVDTIYLDVWEREVNGLEDIDLINPLIGLESCVRLKREWVVRVRTATGVPVFGDADYVAGHVYFELGTMVRRAGVDRIEATSLSDRRARNLLVPPSTLIEDVLGTSYALYRRGEDRPLTSLRTAINALLRGDLPASEATILAAGALNNVASKAIVEDSQQNLWAFFVSNRTGNDDIFVRRYLAGIQAWETDQAITTDPAGDTEPVSVIDSTGDIWLFWNTIRGGATQSIWVKRYRQATATWDADFELVTSAADDFQQFVFEDGNANLWLFWMSLRDAAKPSIWLKRYIRAADDWTDDPLVPTVTSAGQDQLPRAVQDATGTVYLIWQSDRDGDDHIFWNTFNSNGVVLGADQRINPAAADDERSPFLLIDNQDNLWAFWRVRVAGFFQIQYGRFNRATSTWTVDPTLTTGNFNNFDPLALTDSLGNIWLFWRSARSTGEVILYRIFNGATSSWSTERAVTPAPADYTLVTAIRGSSGAIWVFWTLNQGPTTQAYYRQFFPII